MENHGRLLNWKFLRIDYSSIKNFLTITVLKHYRTLKFPIICQTTHCERFLSQEGNWRKLVHIYFWVFLGFCFDDGWPLEHLSWKLVFIQYFSILTLTIIVLKHRITLKFSIMCHTYHKGWKISLLTTELQNMGIGTHFFLGISRIVSMLENHDNIWVSLYTILFLNDSHHNCFEAPNYASYHKGWKISLPRKELKNIWVGTPFVLSIFGFIWHC